MALEQDEADERDGRDRKGAEDAHGAPPVAVGLDQPVREGEQADRGREQPRKIGPLTVRRVLRLVDQQEARGDRDQPDRHVDVEDRAPADVLGEQAADQRADRERERRDTRPDADRRAALARRERGRDDRERGRVHQRGAGALDDAGADQEPRARRERAGERGAAEDRQADDEDAPAPEQVGQLAAGEHQRGECERVAGDDPLELREPGPELTLDRGQRHVHDRVVEHDHEQAEADGRERPPLAVLGGD